MDGTSEETVRALRAGAALYNAGEFHAAHAPWEERWLALGGDAGDGDGAGTGAGDVPSDPTAGDEGAGGTDRDTAERRLLKGLIQLTAAVYHATERNWAGATGLAASAREYLAAVEAPVPGGLALDPIRSYLEAFAADPVLIERRPPVRLELDGTVVGPADLAFDAATLAAAALAEEHGYEERVLERAAAFGRADLEAGQATSPFVALIFDFVAGENRPLVFRRLEDHVDRREHRESGVAGLFDVDGGESESGNESGSAGESSSDGNGNRDGDGDGNSGGNERGGDGG